MNRDRFESLIDEYLEGDLDLSRRREVEVLIETEPGAGDLVARRRRLLADLGRLARDAEPRRDLWPAIDAATRRRAPWVPVLLAAGLALAAVGLVWLFRPAPPVPVASAPATALAAVSGTGVRRPAVLEAEQILLDTKDELRAALAGRRAALPPETRQQVDANLEIIESAIAEILIAISTDPDNEELHRTLVAYHQRELSLLERATRAAARL